MANLDKVYCLAKFNNAFYLFNQKNRWQKVCEEDAISDEAILNGKFLFNDLLDSVDNIKFDWVLTTTNDDGSKIYESEELVETNIITELSDIESEIDGEYVPQILATVPNFTPKDKLTNNALIYAYSNEEYNPEIYKVTFSDTRTHNANIFVDIESCYNYNEKVKYSVKINDGDYGDYTETYSPYEKARLKILASDLQLGQNTITIKIVTEDEQKFTEKVLRDAILVYNEMPSLSLIKADIENSKFHFRIDDADFDAVVYSIKLKNDNGEFDIYESNSLLITPVQVAHTIPSSLIIPEKENTLIIEFSDIFGDGGTFEHTFIGKYTNLIFINEEGEYYSTDRGVTLKELDFGQLQSGQVSEIKEIKLKNLCTTPVKNIKIKAEPLADTSSGINVQLSKTKNPFKATDKLEFNNMRFDIGEEVGFYIRIDTERNAMGYCDFKISAESSVTK